MGQTLKSMPVILDDPDNYKEYFVGMFQFDGTYNLRLADYSSSGMFVDTIYLQPNLTNFPQSGLAIWANYQDDTDDIKALFGKTKAASSDGNYMWAENERGYLPEIYNVYSRLRGNGISHNFYFVNAETNQTVYNSSVLVQLL